MGRLKDPKKEKFTQLWHQGNKKAEAYRQSHPACKRWKAETVHKRASELSLTREVQGRYEELQEEAGAIHGITVKSLLKELEEARESALHAETPQSSAAVSASMAKAKLCGFDVNKVDLSSADGTMSPKAISDDEFADKMESYGINIAK